MLVVIEGIEGSGKTTIVEWLKTVFEDNFSFARYPDDEKPIGKLIRYYLSGKEGIEAEALTLLFLADFFKDLRRLRNSLGKKKENLLLDRYATSTIAYEGALGIGAEKVLEVVKILNLPEPDLVLFLDIPPELGLQRKGKFRREIFEKDVKFLERVRENYLWLAEKKAFGREWVIIDATRKLKAVKEECKRAIEMHL